MVLSGKRTNKKLWAKSPWFMGKLTISMAIFYSRFLYVYQAG